MNQMTRAIPGIPSEALAIARAFAKGSNVYDGPRVPYQIRGSERVYLVGSEEFTIPVTEPFNSFLVKYLRERIGREWFRERAATKRGSTHPLIRIGRNAHRYAAMAVRAAKLANQSHYVFCGAQREVCTLADDMVTLELIGALPSSMIDRLRQYNGFQGVRYEFAVAACFARLGFRVEWLPTHERGPEFIARHPITGDSLVVEAKSRHRGSEFQFVSRASAEAVQAVEADILRLYHSAKAKETKGWPFAIFIDANVPYRRHSDNPILSIEGLSGSNSRLPLCSADEPAPEFLLCITTCGWYYSLLTPACPVRKVTTFPVWTKATPRNFNTYVAILQCIESMYTSPQSDDRRSSVSEEFDAAVAFPSNPQHGK